MNTPRENIINILKGKTVLFLENGTSLEYGLDRFENILKESGIEYITLFKLSERPLSEITKAISDHDAIVFMTRWVYDISHELHDYMVSLKEKKIVIEVYISEPTWYYKPDVIHDVYIYNGYDLKHENFYKLSKTAYWDYKNNFDK